MFTSDDFQKEFNALYGFLVWLNMLADKSAAEVSLGFEPLKLGVFKESQRMFYFCRLPKLVATIDKAVTDLWWQPLWKDLGHIYLFKIDYYNSGRCKSRVMYDFIQYTA